MRRERAMQRSRSAGPVAFPRATVAAAALERGGRPEVKLANWRATRPAAPARSGLAARGGRADRPGIRDHAKIATHDAVLYMLAADIGGGMLLAALVFHLQALPLGCDPRQFWCGLATFPLAWACGAGMQRLYSRATLLDGFGRLLLRATLSCATAFGLMLLAGFALDLIGGVSRLWLLTWAASVFVLGQMTRLAWRLCFERQLRRGARVERALVVAGSERAAALLGETIELESGFHIGVVTCVALPGLLGAPTLEWVEALLRGGGVDRVILGDWSGAVAQADALLARLTRVAVDVTVIPSLGGLEAPALKMDRIGTLPAIDLDHRPLTPAQVRLKRLEDLLLAGLGTVFILPVLLLIALAIKLDSPGPVLFRQRRAGYNDRVFRVWKFRTMHAHASDELSRRQTTRGDTRVTRVGRILRQTSLDELPQLFNVLTGDMSIVGPRPHALGMTSVGLPLHEVIEDYSARHRLKPGITGWAQVNGSRGEVDSHDKLRRRVALDCDYIENWSLRLDLWIMLRTAAILLRDRNAY